MACQYGDLTLTPALFQDLAGPLNDAESIQGSWSFVEGLLDSVRPPLRRGRVGFDNLISAPDVLGTTSTSVAVSEVFQWLYTEGVAVYRSRIWSRYTSLRCTSNDSLILSHFVVVLLRLFGQINFTEGIFRWCCDERHLVQQSTVLICCPTGVIQGGTSSTRSLHWLTATIVGSKAPSVSLLFLLDNPWSRYEPVILMICEPRQ